MLGSTGSAAPVSYTHLDVYKRQTNATVRVLEGVEAPVLDGSAMPIAQAILEAGIEAIPGTRRKQVRVRDALYVQREGSYAIALRCV